MSVPPGAAAPVGATPKWFVPALVVLVVVGAWYLMRRHQSAPAAPAGNVV